MSVIPQRLLPDTASVANNGMLSIGGCTVEALATEHGTPLFVYDETHLRNRAREAVEAFGPDRVIYATKAFLCGAMARLAHDEGLMLDVATGGELFAVRHAGATRVRVELAIEAPFLVLRVVDDGGGLRAQERNFQNTEVFDLILYIIHISLYIFSLFSFHDL